MHIEFTVKQIADLLGAKILGKEDVKINNISGIETAGEKDISFLSNPKYENFIYSTKAGAVLVKDTFKPVKKFKTTLIFTEDPYISFTSLLLEYEKVLKHKTAGIETPVYISKTAVLGENLFIGAFTYISDKVKIGDNTTIEPNVYIGRNVIVGTNTLIYPGVKILDNCIIGNNCTLHSGAVIGSDGFGFAPKKDGSYLRIPQMGNVVLGNNISIGSNTTIDRATMTDESTHIGDGTKIDNLVQIAHNVKIGNNTVIAAQTGISGSTKIGNNCVIGGQVGFAGHISIPDHTSIGAQSGIMGSIKDENKKLMGSPAFELSGYLRSTSVFKKLPEILNRVRTLEEKLLHLRQFEKKE